MGWAWGHLAVDSNLSRIMFRMALAEVPGGIGAKLFDAMPATEMVSPAIVFDRASGGRGNYVHAADGVLDCGTGVVALGLVKDGQAEFVRVHEIEIPLI
jgi:hypothetical protein